jgi:putative oxidoreductase
MRRNIILNVKINKMKLKYLLLGNVSNGTANISLLIFRVIICSLMLKHGIEKLRNFEMISPYFPDPLGVGSMNSLLMILFAEVGCSILIMLGMLTRLATLPLIFGMSIAAFMIHEQDPFAMKELALMYLGPFIVLLISGPGKYSIDYLILRKFSSNDDETDLLV